ncbi:hypothetical protein MAMC_01457 [Methylacidimicrobium cyclopophantes]|uniref:Tubulin-like protein n=1 Tax=Methylacidimicrobium cyclopophantes TaxID=1041766 RepID=A0A5E6MCI4_9BACT|nr:tubulin-like doman-containing protein [Methylacidimicrobium cyclopophantes]VVM07157.1 hypothetical protein MAMC_01457 [Methylacidimicrobium cyclopophantes]
MNPNHMIIGLGGTGGKIIRAVRKTIFQEFRSLNPEDVSIGYLYIDSSDELMRLDDPTWKILGQSVQLGPNSQLHIRCSNLSSILENLTNYPGIRPWIGDRAIWNDILGGIVGDAIGGQKRRLGRFLFANHATEFCDRLTSQVRELQAGGETSVTFHVCTGLAGGTGSGTILDVLCQIRRLYPDSLQYRIIGYLLLPEEHPKPNWNTGNYHANGYAALAELNALSIGKFVPCNIAGDGGKMTGLQTPFNGAYLFTTHNENGLALSVDDIPNVVADFLYQKIVTVRKVNWASLARQENAENGDGMPETIPGTNVGVRSKRWLAFGVKRIAVPEEEIAEYLAYQFARQAALQLRYNNWSETEGYLPNAKNVDLMSYVSAPEQLERWLLSDEHLLLSSPVLEADGTQGRWQPIGRYWTTVTGAFKQDIEEREEGAKWLDSLKGRLELRFSDQYRGHGVKAFYQTVSASARERAREIRQKLERELFGNWRDGARSVHEISGLVGSVITYLRNRSERFDDDVAKAKAQEEALSKKLKDQEKEWAKVGVISDMFGKRKRLFDICALTLQDLYACRTRIEGWQFAKKFTPVLLEEITQLKAELDRSSAMIAEAVKNFEEQIAERCVEDSSQVDYRQQIIRFYDPELVRIVTRRLTKDAREQLTQTQRVRSALVALLGDKLDFRTFNERINKTTFLDVLENQCMENAKISHNNLIESTKERLIGVSIIDKLRDRYGDRQALRLFIDGIVKAAGNYLIFNPDEIKRSAPGINPAAQICVSNFTVILPKAPEAEDFVKMLREIFWECVQTTAREFLDGSKPNEIILTSVTNLFPLRVVQLLSFLRARYLERVNGQNPARARMELHIEGDGQSLPSLFLPSRGELQERIAPYLLLGMALGLIAGRENERGAQELAMLTKDEFGFETPLFLEGATIPEALANIPEPKALTLEEAVGKQLADPEIRRDPKRNELTQKVVSLVNDLVRQLPPTDPRGKSLPDWGRKAVKLLRGEG